MAIAILSLHLRAQYANENFLGLLKIKQRCQALAILV